jgi:hypothetical protein
LAGVATDKERSRRRGVSWKFAEKVAGNFLCDCRMIVVSLLKRCAIFLSHALQAAQGLVFQCEADILT